MYSTLRSPARALVLFASLLSIASHVAAVPTVITSSVKRSEDPFADPDDPDLPFDEDAENPFATCFDTPQDSADEGGPTEDGSPGIGVEFETSAIKFRNDECSKSDTDDAKGKMVDNRHGEEEDDEFEWKLTADTTDDSAGQLTLEYIINGKNVKIGSGRAGEVAEEMFNDLEDFKPAVGTQVDIEDNNCNPWGVSQPATWTGSSGMAFSRQVTAALPLAAMNDLIGIATTQGRPAHPLLPDPFFRRLTQNLVHVTEDYFQALDDTDDLTEDVYGFFSLILSYAKKADTVAPGQSVKKLTSLMPRTDFQTMYDMISDDLEDAIDEAGSLFDIVKVLACYTMEEDDLVIDSNFCDGDVDSPEPSSKLEDLEFHLTSNGKSKDLNVKTWIDGLESGDGDALKEADKVVDGQVGGYGDATETLLGNDDVEVPLFEFRDLGSSMPANFRTDVEAAEQAIIDYHDDFGGDAKRRTRRAAAIKRGLDPDEIFAACPFWGPPKNGSNSTTEARRALPTPVRIPIAFSH